MNALAQFKQMTESLEESVLADLCEQFVYDHEGAMKTTLEFARRFNLKISSEEAKEFITAMHKNGDFDHVECWGLPLGGNDLYKKFHP